MLDERPRINAGARPGTHNHPISEHERAKYDAIWGIDEYHENSPGAGYVDLFERVAKPGRGSSIIDVGAGAGAASRKLKDGGYDVTAFDLSDEGWKHSDIHLRHGCIWRDLHPGLRDFAYCADVMEHIPTELVGLTIDRILNSAHRAFFAICFLPDAFGSHIGEPLHLTVKPFVWWRDLFRELGTLYEARDLIDNGIFFASR